MHPTQKQIFEIARATKKVCSANGQGSGVNVWPDFSWSEEPTPDTPARRTQDGSIERRLRYFREPLTRQQVADILAARADRG